LKALSIADVLEFLRGLNRQGLLSVTSEGAAIGLYLSAGRVVHATSTRDADRLTELLLRWGLIGPEQHEETMRRLAAGERLGKALVSGGGLTPRDLMGARLRQATQIGLSLFEWDSGDFVFTEGEEPHDEGIAVDLPIGDLVVQGIRSVRNLRLFRERLPSPDWVFEPIPVAERKSRVALETHEEYVLHLVDGRRTVGAIAGLSEFPDLETLRVLFLLFLVGHTKMKAQPVGDDVTEDAPGEAVPHIVRRYNGMFGHVYRYLMREVGPISDHLLARSLREMRTAHPVLFSRAALGGDGTLDDALLQENLRGLREGRQRDALVQGLNEFLYSELLVLRRTLGAEHERRVLRAFREVPTGGERALGGPR
jgi:hypothetical protein